MISRTVSSAHSSLSSLRLFSCVLPALLVACSASTTGPDGQPLPADLAAGECPASILSIQSDTQWDTRRYGSRVDVTRARELQALEISNCQTQVAGGNVRALRVLESHYNQQRDIPRLVTNANAFLASNGDTDVKRQLAMELHTLYTEGRYDFRPNPNEALRYLGVAVSYGETSLRPQYAATLLAAGDYDEAFGQYSALVSENSGNRESRCEYRLQLAYLYFAGAGTPQNSFLGYYYWERGLELADGPQWGSCIADNFSDQRRWRRETDRLKYVAPLIDALSATEKSAIAEAGRLPLPEGHQRVAAMNYDSSGTPATVSQPIVQSQPGSGPGWPGWAPMQGGICAMQYSNTAVTRATLFSDAGNAVWTLLSENNETAVLGSAVAVSPSILLTNCHVISNPAAIRLQNPLGERRARLVAADLDGDRCILSASEPTSAFLGRARPHDQVMVGEDVSAVGSPKGMTNTLSRGIVAGKRTRSGIRLIQTDAALSTGSSGGGLFDNRGNLIGITTFQIPGADSLNFAISVEEYCAR